MEVNNSGMQRSDTLLSNYLLQAFRDPGSVDMVGATCAAGIAGQALPDQVIVQGLLSIAQNH